MKLKYTIILAIFALSLIASIILSFIPLEQACGGTSNSCSTVQTSNYESLFWIKNSYLGMIGFSILSVLTISHLRNPKRLKKLIISTGIILAALLAVYFLYLQFFVINAVCKYCIVVDIGSIINVGILFLWKEK
jgi:uncharacterized membrane protein